MKLLIYILGGNYTALVPFGMLTFKTEVLNLVSNVQLVKHLLL